MPSPPEARIDVTAIEHSFNDPARSVELVSEVLESALDALANALLPDVAMALPEFSSVTRTNWRGPNEIIGAVIEGFKREADALTIELGTLVEAQLRRARLEEEAGGIVAASTLYETVVSVFRATAVAPWDATKADLLKRLEPADKKLRERLEPRLITRGRRAAYGALAAKSDGVLADARRHVWEHERNILVGRIAGYAGKRLAALKASKKAFVASATDTNRASERGRALDATSIAIRRTSARHDTSLPPERGVIEKMVSLSVPFMAGGHVVWDEFWRRFGAWASAQDLLPAEEGANGAQPSLDGELCRFMAEKALEGLGALDLAALFGRTGTPLPLQDLKGRSEIPIDLAQLADMDSANALVRVVEMPEGLPGAVVDNGWTVVTGQDRRRIKMVQDYRCFSARAVLDLPREEWQQALKLEHVLYETSTQPLHDAVKERRIVPRIRGELVQASRAR